MQSRVLLIDNSTGGGEPIPVEIKADDTHVIIEYLSGMLGWTLKIDRDAVLAVIETEEHG